MPTTEPTYGWSLPVAADPPDGPGQFAALASGIAGTLSSLVRPVCSVHKTIDQGIPETTVTLLTGWTAHANVGGFTVGSNGVTVPETGTYLVVGSMAFDGDGSAEVRAISWLGTLPFASQAFTLDVSRTMVMWKPFTNNAVQGHTMTHSVIANLTAGDEIGMGAYHDYSGTSSKVLNLRGGYETQFGLTRL